MYIMYKLMENLISDRFEWATFSWSFFYTIIYKFLYTILKTEKKLMDIKCEVDIIVFVCNFGHIIISVNNPIIIIHFIFQNIYNSLWIDIVSNIYIIIRW